MGELTHRCERPIHVVEIYGRIFLTVLLFVNLNGVFQKFCST